MFDGLRQYVQVCGVARHMLPVEGRGDVDVEATQRVMLDPGNFDAVPTVRTQNMPRASKILVNYWASYLYLALHYSKTDDAAMVEEIISTMKNYVSQDVVPIPQSLRESVEKLENWAAENG